MIQVLWKIAVANSRDRTIDGILPVWFGLWIAIGSCGFAIVSAGDLLSIRASWRIQPWRRIWME